jgi:FtsP/CotA-like multicopper oxidase with cupredoxin domain
MMVAAPRLSGAVRSGAFRLTRGVAGHTVARPRNGRGRSTPSHVMLSLPPLTADRAHRPRRSVTVAAATLGLCVAAVAPALSIRAMPGAGLHAAPARVGSVGPTRAHVRADAATDTTRAVPNDNRRVAGRRAGRVVTLVLEPRATRWTPVPGDLALARPVLAWAEPGRAPEVPGPLVRARVGDTLRLTLRNPLARTCTSRGSPTARAPTGNATRSTSPPAPRRCAWCRSPGPAASGTTR